MNNELKFKEREQDALALKYGKYVGNLYISGKTRYGIKPDLLQTNCSYIFHARDDEMLNLLGNVLKEKGYKVKVFNPADPEHSSHYNPFEYVRNADDIYRLVNALMTATDSVIDSQNLDPFWRKSEVALLQAICFYLYYECDKESQNFKGICKMVDVAFKHGKTLDSMFEILEEKDSGHIAVRMYAIFCKATGTKKVRNSVIVSVVERLKMFYEEKVQKLTESDDLMLNKIGDEPTALFCIESLPSYDIFFSVMYTQIFDTPYFYARTECKGG